MIRSIRGKFGFRVLRESNPVCHFHSDQYLRHNARRLEHLASLKIPVAGKSVLEIGAGIGDHSHYYIDRGCRILITEARSENLRYLRKRYPHCGVQFLDMEHPSDVSGFPFDLTHCYGLLYHLSNPDQALNFLGRHTSGQLLLETCVSLGDSEQIDLIGEARSTPTQAYSGTGCRPTRTWLFRKLRSLFEYVYLPKTQPNHEEFPLDWAAPQRKVNDMHRAIFIASREPLDNDQLMASLPLKQIRHE